MGISPFRHWVEDDYDYDKNKRSWYPPETIYIEVPALPSVSPDARTETVLTGNPDPSNFEIRQIERVGQFVIARVRYPDCYNFEGEKILVFKDVTVKAIRALTMLDPHFSNAGQLSPFARFVPTKAGWKLAVAACRCFSGLS